MELVERHIISYNHQFYKEASDLCWRGKNLYNYSNYLVRQSFIKSKKYLDNCQIYHLLKQHESYKCLPAKVSNQVLISLHKNWKSFFQAIQEWSKHPEKFLGRPKLPQYKDKQKGRYFVVYEKGAISKRALKLGLVKLSGTNIEFPTKIDVKNLLQVRIIPKCGQYVIEVVYKAEKLLTHLDTSLVASIDIGIDNLAALTSNQLGFKPVLVNGKPLKSINHYYNKRKALGQSCLKSSRQISRKIEELTRKRNNRVDNYLHCCSRFIINKLVEFGIGTLVIGKNDNWKQSCNLGKINNQNFTNIPHARFIDMLEYKAELVGITVLIHEESYTSVASFLDNDPIPVYQANNKHTIKFAGVRTKKWYRSASGTVHADVNGSLNIMRKVVPAAFSLGISGVAVHPYRVTPVKVA
ncbi:IS200/IS605 family element transposase accessory protein TnpB [Hassallia byssoidea VB512170]|uniref:IS200/IS605 family element transposase accessory protein TnpB n=1 Tax=Hassallia byssoidea VB512170 TaxID=1304833 RepID=A0A846H4Z5_9CYAN|nr:RNA-guided endonuclease TnpB family protein [Hassalia byssoidea]NEU71689.1 IS200/IS605 family element transposase accessory protein TnpB [Hassalia byssoidea VB512170]